MLDTSDAVKWMRIASFGDADTAHVARLQLDAEDIPNYLDNENVATLLWYMQPAVGGVYLCVPQEFADQARSLLHPASQEDEQVESDDAAPDDTSTHLAYASLHRCPKCQSTDTEEITWWRRIMQTAMIVSIGVFLVVSPVGMLLITGYAVYFLATKPARCCGRCRHRWTPHLMG